MTIKKLAIKLCKLEGKKKQVNVAQMMEILSALSDMIYAQYAGKRNVRHYKTIGCILFMNGKKRAFKKDSHKVK